MVVYTERISARGKGFGLDTDDRNQAGCQLSGGFLQLSRKLALRIFGVDLSMGGLSSIAFWSAPMISNVNQTKKKADSKNTGP